MDERYCNRYRPKMQRIFILNSSPHEDLPYIVLTNDAGIINQIIFGELLDI